LTQFHDELISALLKGPVMVEKGSNSDILDAAAVAGSNAETLQVGLLARMSHEMRTPLSAILGFAQLLESGSPSPTVSQKRSITWILQAGWYLEKLINMTRDLALIESGTLSLSLEPVPLAAVMLDVKTMIESQAQVRRVHVTFPRFDVPCSVSADRSRLQEVLGNLLAAAIEKSEVDGTVVVNCETHGPEWIRIGINDDTFSERRTKSSQPFDGLEQKATAVEGTGIGLLLAKRLVGLMGGAIAAESIDGARKVLSFDLKRTLVPIAAGRTSAHSAFRETGVPTDGRPQGTVYSSDNHAHQR
jgi:signal transduction histidine kinase